MCLSFLCSRPDPPVWSAVSVWWIETNDGESYVAEQELGCPAIIVNPQSDGNTSCKLTKLRQEDCEFEAVLAPFQDPRLKSKLSKQKSNFKSLGQDEMRNK